MRLANSVRILFLVAATVVQGPKLARAATAFDMAETKNEMMFQGKVVRPDGSLLNGDFQVTVRLFSPLPSRCLLWSESAMVKFTDGGFSLSLGKAGNRIAGQGSGVSPDFSTAFLNNPSVTFSNAKCAAGISYTPNTTDDRVLEAAIMDGTNLVEISSVPIKSVPYAMHAEMIGGFRLQNIMKISGDSSVVFTPAETTSLKDLLGGDIDWNMKGRRLTNVADPSASSDAATRGWVETLTAASTGPRPQNLVYASPIVGTGPAAFRAIDPTDVPLLDTSKLSTGVLPAVRGGTGLVPAMSEANKVYALNSGGTDTEFKAISGGTGMGITHTAGDISIYLQNTAVGAGSYGDSASVPSFTVDAQGRLTAAANVAIGNLNASSISAGTLAAARMPALTGDVTTTVGTVATTVVTVGGETAANVASGAILANAATELNTASTIVKRGALGEFAAGAITATSFTGNGANITDLDMGNVTTGILPVARGGTGTATGSITGTGALTFTAGGANSNVTLASTGTGIIYLNGSVGIGTSTPSEKLEVIGNVRATNFVATSDRRLKTNIRRVPDGLDIIRQLTGYSYNWKSNGEGDYGVIAQEVERVMPNAVRTDSKTGLKAVKYNNLVAPMIQSIKQLDSKVQNLEKENADLRNRLDHLEKLVQKLSADHQ